MTADKPTLKPPPPLGGSRRGVAAGAGPKPAPNAPHLTVQSAPAPDADHVDPKGKKQGHGPTLAPPSIKPGATHTEKGARAPLRPAVTTRPVGSGAAPSPAAPQVTISGASSRSETARAAAIAAIPRGVTPTNKVSGPKTPAHGRDAQRRSPGIPASRRALEARPPQGTVRSSRAVAEVMRAARELVDLLMEENAALRDHKMDSVRALGERKVATTRLYRERMLVIQKDPALLSELPEDEREIVRQMGIYLDAHLAENASLLKATLQGTQRLMDLMVQAAKQATEEKAPGYAADGRLEAPHHVSARLAMSFNETL